jgi:FkbM family methyltransferase
MGLPMMKYHLLKLARLLGYDVQRYGDYRDPLVRFRHALERHEVRVLLDVGANVGQFGQLLRLAGYRHQIISFEPLSNAHAQLQAMAMHDPDWTVAPRCAVAGEEGVMEIHIAGNSKSSSMLDMTQRHVAGDPRSAYVGKEQCTVITLDSYLDRSPNLHSVPLAVKIDTQGSEAQVLSGLVKWSHAIEVISTELSLASLYEGQCGFSEMFRRIEERGYRCTSIEPGFTDPRTREMLQVDATFERA